MKRRNRGLVAILLSVLLLFSMATSAFAWSWRHSSISSLTCSYQHRSSSTTTAVRNAFNQAANDWGNAVSEVDFYVSSSSANEVYAVHIVGSLERGAMDLFGPSYPGTGTYARDYYTNFYAYINTAFSQGTNAYRSTANHEFGHVLGLDHVSGTAIMNGNRNVESIYTPRSDDRNGVETIWGL